MVLLENKWKVYKMNKRFLVILAAVILLLGGIFWLTSDKKAAAPTSQAQLSNHTIGGGKSGVVLIEYGDFACPACYQYYPLVEQVHKKYNDQITFQFRNYPLVEIHQNALIGARAAEAANLQGKFWEMYNLLYTNQPSWRDSNNPSAAFDSYAQQLGLNVNKFRQDIASEQVNNIVQADRAEAKRLGFDGTPTFVLNGKKVEENPTSLDAFNKLIDAAITAKKTSQ